VTPIDVPLTACGLGTGTARVRDALTGGTHSCSADRLVAVGGVLCAVFDSKREARGLHLVSLPGGPPMVWVRPLAPVPA